MFVLKGYLGARAPSRVPPTHPEKGQVPSFRCRLWYRYVTGVFRVLSILPIFPFTQMTGAY